MKIEIILEIINLMIAVLAVLVSAWYMIKNFLINKTMNKIFEFFRYYEILIPATREPNSCGESGWNKITSTLIKQNILYSSIIHFANDFMDFKHQDEIAIKRLKDHLKNYSVLKIYKSYKFWKLMNRKISYIGSKYYNKWDLLETKKTWSLDGLIDYKFDSSNGLKVYNHTISLIDELDEQKLWNYKMNILTTFKRSKFDFKEFKKNNENQKMWIKSLKNLDKFTHNFHFKESMNYKDFCECEINKFSVYFSKKSIRIISVFEYENWLCDKKSIEEHLDFYRRCLNFIEKSFKNKEIVKDLFKNCNVLNKNKVLFNKF